MLSDIEKKNIAEAIREDAHQAYGIQKLLCRGKCMVPILDDDAEVLVRDCRPDNVGIGDIVLYEYEGRLMLHRYICTRKGPAGALVIVTKADTALSCDPPIGAESLIGKVVEIERSGRSVRIDRYLWPLAFRVTGILSLLEWLAWYIRMKLFSRLVVRYENRRFIRKTVLMPKLLFTRAMAALMRFPKN